MAIKILEQVDIYLTASELAAYREEYRKAFSHYVGPLPDFEDWVGAQERDRHRCDILGAPVWCAQSRKTQE